MIFFKMLLKQLDLKQVNTGQFIYMYKQINKLLPFSDHEKNQLLTMAYRRYYRHIAKFLRKQNFKISEFNVLLKRLNFCHADI